MANTSLRAQHSMELMELPDELLEEIIFKLMSISWQATDFARTSKRIMSLYAANKRKVELYLYQRPYSINPDRTMVVCSFGMRYITREVFQHTLKHLQIGHIKRLDIQLRSAPYYDQQGKLHWMHYTIDELDLLLHDWPANKIAFTL